MSMEESMAGIFLDASVLAHNDEINIIREDIKQNNIRFEFPEGFNTIPVIEECRALNALDLREPDNFDLMYDITIQLLIGKAVFIYLLDEKDIKHEIAKFVVTDRYMNLRGIDIIDEYPVVVNWLVEFVAAHLAKKFPRSLKEVQAAMSVRKERMKSLNEQNIVIRTS